MFQTVWNFLSVKIGLIKQLHAIQQFKPNKDLAQSPNQSAQILIAYSYD